MQTQLSSASIIYRVIQEAEKVVQVANGLQGAEVAGSVNSVTCCPQRI